MKKRKLIIGSLVAAMLAPISLCFAGCGNKPEKFDINAKDVYAMCAASSVEYLKNIAQGSESVSKVVPLNGTSRPSAIEEADVIGMRNTLSMFGEIVESGIEQKTQINTTDILGLKDYKFEMEIKFPRLYGAKKYKMYYTEIKTETEEEIDEAGLEVEVSTTIEGILLVDGEHYAVRGEREFEKEGKEEESSISFTTYLDNENFITIEQSVENKEVEYECSIYKNNMKIQECEFEMEKTSNGYDIDFQITELSGENSSIEFEINLENYEIVAVLKKGNTKEVIGVEIVETGFKFNYSNGFFEFI